MNKDKNRHYKTYKLIGQNIRRIRKSKNISQEELAFRITSARNYIGCIERAEKIPSIAILLDIAGVLNCTIDSFFENSNQ